MFVASSVDILDFGTGVYSGEFSKMRFSLFSLALIGAVSSAFAQSNVAASVNGGVASQSSVYNGTAIASRANDGNRDGRYSQGSVQHTNSNVNAWWNVDFNGSHLIDIINVWNRDEFTTRINPFNVILSLDGSVVWSSMNNTFVDTINDGNVNTLGMSFAPGGVLADSLKIQLADTNYLHMAEVEAITVVPEPATMAALGLGVAALLRRKRNKV